MLPAGAKMLIAALALLILLTSPVSTIARAADGQVCDATADFALGREDYLRAIVSHRALLQSQPDNALAHYHLGFAYGMVGRSSEELIEYETAARLGLKDWDLFLNLGLAYLGHNESEEATKAFETAVALGAEHSAAHLNLAIVYESEHRLEEALGEITIARRLAPRDLEAANMDAIISFEIGDIAHARDIWTRLVQFAPDNVAVRANLSMLDQYLASKGQFEQQAQISYSHAEPGAARNGNLGILQMTRTNG
jgi:Flp pilus assembly protein TadD